MTTIRLRFGTRNSPESMKRGLLKDRLKRALRAERWTIRQRIDVCGTQEAGTYAELVDGESPSRKVLWGKVNSYVRGRWVANGIDVNRWRWKSRLVENIPVGRGEDAVNIPVVQITERWPRPRRRQPWVQKVYGVHKPTRRAINANLRPVIDRVLREHTKRDDEAGMPWTVLGDFNGPFDHGVELGDHGVDSIRGSHHFEPVGQFVFDRPPLSDHDFLVADAVVEV